LELSWGLGHFLRVDVFSVLPWLEWLWPCPHSSSIDWFPFWPTEQPQSTDPVIRSSISFYQYNTTIIQCIQWFNNILNTPYIYLQIKKIKNTLLHYLVHFHL
jgi:hypothetical protein